MLATCQVLSRIQYLKCKLETIRCETERRGLTQICRALNFRSKIFKKAPNKDIHLGKNVDMAPEGIARLRGPSLPIDRPSTLVILIFPHFLDVRMACSNHYRSYYAYFSLYKLNQNPGAVNKAIKSKWNENSVWIPAFSVTVIPTASGPFGLEVTRKKRLDMSTNRINAKLAAISENCSNFTLPICWHVSSPLLRWPRYSSSCFFHQPGCPNCEATEKQQ